MRTFPDLFQAISQAINVDEYARIPTKEKKKVRHSNGFGDPQREGTGVSVSIRETIIEDISHTVDCTLQSRGIRGTGY